MFLFDSDLELIHKTNLSTYVAMIAKHHISLSSSWAFQLRGSDLFVQAYKYTLNFGWLTGSQKFVTSPIHKHIINNLGYFALRTCL